MPPGSAIPRITADRRQLIVLAAIVAACALFGGSARADNIWLLALRPLCCLAFAASLILPLRAARAQDLRVPILLVGVFALVIALQLMPLPPWLWAKLPGHERYAETASLAGLVQSWHPISLTPWLTWNSLLAVLPIAGALLCIDRGNLARSEVLVVAYLGVVATNLLLGVFQVAGVLHGPPLEYAFAHKNSAIGFFTNRNHAAVLLATAFPVLRLWVELARPDPSRWKRRAAIGMVLAAFLVPVIMATGSRSGMIVALAAIAAALWVAPLRPNPGTISTTLDIGRIALWAAPVVIVVVIAMTGAADSLNRLVQANLFAERRVELLPVNLELVKDFFPVGSGFGSFDQVFRAYEPADALRLSYFNHAHNDLLELGITGGFPALALLALLMLWIGWRWRKAGRGGEPGEQIYVRTGAIVAALWFAGSLTDYPLRTPLAAVLFIVAIGWLCPMRSSTSAPAR